MRLGIDASNIRAGGGVTHLVELLRAADPIDHGFSQVFIWGSQSTLRLIEDRPWLVKGHQPWLEKSLAYRALWQRFRLAKLARAAGCDILFIPGGSYTADFRPIVTMSQNLLPFEWGELRRYGWSWMTLKLLMLRLTQSRTFRRADGLIFLTPYARGVVMGIIKTIAGRTAIIPHGINGSFVRQPREQKSINQYSSKHPFRILYVSIIDVYKHQWHVAEALAKLRKSGLPVALDLVGPAYPPALTRLRKTLGWIDPSGEFVRHSGPVLHAELYERYAQADLGLFASSCENMPNILLEAMASGLPIACSRRGPMPGILGEAGIYFDPEKPDEIAGALRTLIEQPAMRRRLAIDAHQKAMEFTWESCAKETFSFLAQVAKDLSSTLVQIDFEK